MKKNLLNILFTLLLIGCSGTDSLNGGSQSDTPSEPSNGQQHSDDTKKYTTTLYVDGTHGDNSNDGSLNQPFKTIQAGVDVAKPGDRVLVKAGLYHERVKVKTSGTKTKRITIEAEKDKNGKRLVTLHGGDLVKATWVKSDLYPLAYETRDIPYESFATVIKKEGVYYDIPTLDTKLKKDKTYLEGSDEYKGQFYRYDDILKLPKDKKIFLYNYNKTNHGHHSLKINYWDGIEAVYAYKDGKSYIRFRNGDNPNNMKIYTSPGQTNPFGNHDIQHYTMMEGAGFKLHNVSNIHIKGFNIEGAQNGVLIYGSKATNNTIDDNEITNGQRRVSLAQMAHNNIIKNNKVHMRMLDKRFRPGAWYGWWSDGIDNSKRYAYAVSHHIYSAYKHEIGRATFSPLDDCGIFVDGAGSNNEIVGNEIYDTLGGIAGSHIGKIKIHDNTLHHISSIATGLVKQNTDESYIYKNNMYNVHIAYRVQLNMNLDELDLLAKKSWFYENIIFNPPNIGSGIFMYRGDNLTKPTSSTQLPRIYIYHNTFVGGGRDANNVKDTGEKIALINNIFHDVYPSLSGGDDFGRVENNWFNMSQNYSGSNLNEFGKKLWNNLPQKVDSMPNFTLPPYATARGAGHDLSKPIKIGTESILLPLTKDFYKNGTSTIGAIQ